MCDKDLSRWIDAISCLEPEDFLGLAMWLDVKILTDSCDPTTKKAIPRDPTDIALDCLEKIEAMPRNERRALFKELRRPLKKRGN